MESAKQVQIKSLTAKVSRSSLEQAFKFAVDYHLNPKKGQTNRTTGQTRGLGGVLDSFLRGKIVEQAVVDVLKKLNPKKDYHPDFLVHDVGDDDPDIWKVTENRVKRDPLVFVEIKNTSGVDRWFGLTEEQFNTIKENEVVGDDLEKIFIVYASIKNKNSSDTKMDDLLGVFLKNELSSKMYDNFAELEDLYVEIILVVSAAELLKKGTRFEKGYYFYETEIFQEVKPKTLQMKAVKKIKNSSSVLPKFRYDKKYPYPEKFGDIICMGKFELYKKENEKSNRMYLHCISNVEVTNKVLGTFNFEKGKVYEYMPKTLSRDPVLKRNNIWIAKRNATRVVESNAHTRLKEIAEKI